MRWMLHSSLAYQMLGIVWETQKLAIEIMVIRIIKPKDLVPRSAWLCFGVIVGWRVVDGMVEFEVPLSVVDDDEMVDVGDRWSGTSRRSFDLLVDPEVVMMVLKILDVEVGVWVDVLVLLATEVKVEYEELEMDEADALVVDWDDAETRVEVGVKDEVEVPSEEGVKVDDPVTYGPVDADPDTDDELKDAAVDEGEERASETEVDCDEGLWLEEDTVELGMWVDEYVPVVELKGVTVPSELSLVGRDDELSPLAWASTTVVEAFASAAKGSSFKRLSEW